MLRNELSSDTSFVCHLRIGTSRGAVTEIVEALLQRCVHETDPEARVLLATCFGEVGAVGSHRLEEAQITSSTVDSFQRSSDPPWRSTPHGYELKLIATHLVVGLKAAPTSSDQHKIAFSIQQLLALLNEAAKEGRLPGPSSVVKQTASKRLSSSSRSNFDKFNRATDLITKPPMERALLDKLVSTKVLDIVEPFWFSEFHEVSILRFRFLFSTFCSLSHLTRFYTKAENNPPRQPPFFRVSSTFYGWLSNWCRYMVHRSHSTSKNDWTELFFACRTALRTQAGLSVAESLLPLLVLDRLCFGGVFDQNILVSEITDVLTIGSQDNGGTHSMSRSDLRKAVSTIFSLIDLLQHWVEPETDEKYTVKERQNQAKSRKRRSSMPACSPENSGWQQSDSKMLIEDMVGKIPYSLRAKASQ